MSEVRLINANALMERLERKKCETAKIRYTEGFNDALMRFRSMVHGAPTVDAVPMVHGEWLDKLECGSHWSGRCSVCLHELCIDVWYTGNMNYCPNCGARMDKERKENALD